MSIFNIFDNDAFSQAELIAAVEHSEYKPTRMSSLNIFTPKPVRTEVVAIEKRDSVLSLVQTSPRGAPLEQRTTRKRDLRNFNTLRIGKSDRITASELQFLRAFGEEQQVAELQAELAQRMDGPGGLMDDIDMTLEHMRLGAIQGNVVDADGTTVLYNWFTEWGVTQDAVIDFDLDNASPAPGALRKKCNQVVRQMARNSQGLWNPMSSKVHAMCSDSFFDDLVAHPEIRQLYHFTGQSELVPGGDPYQSITYGGITFENYHGTDDLSTLVIPDGEAKLFPTNTPGAFLEAMSPGETFEDLGKQGQKYYPMITRDLVRNTYVDLEIYSYPLHICTRPKMLLDAVNT